MFVNAPLYDGNSVKNTDEVTGGSTMNSGKNPGTLFLAPNSHVCVYFEGENIDRT